MEKQSSQIKRFYCIEDAFFIAFSFLFRKERPKEKEGDYHMSFSKRHFKLKSSNPPDTIEVATFMRHKKGTPNDKNIKKEYYYVCEFKWESYGERKDFFDFEEAKKMRERPPTIKTDHLLFFIRWNSDFSCWERIPILCCSNASSHHEAADWMLNEITANGYEVCNSENFWKDGIFSCFSDKALSQSSNYHRKATKNDKISAFITIFSFILLLSFPSVMKENTLLGFVTAAIGGGMLWVSSKKHPNWKGYPWT